MPPALKILVDVAVFRLRRFEMANIAGALAIGVACHLGVVELAFRGLFAFLLNLLVYLNNDWYDLDDDLDAVAKDQTKNAYLAAHLGAGVRAQLGLLALLVALALVWGGGLLVALIAGGGVCWAYSAGLKRVPFLDVLAMIAWGMAMPMVGLAPGHPEGWLLLGQLGLFSGVFESIQVIRDHDADKAAGVRTTAVVLGLARARVLVRALMIAAAVYAALCFAWWIAGFVVVAIALPLQPDDTPGGTNIDQYWNRVRVLLGLALIAEAALVFFGGAG